MTTEANDDSRDCRVPAAKSESKFPLSWRTRKAQKPPPHSGGHHNNDKTALTYIGRRFGSSQVSGMGVFCGIDGVYVGAIPLLEKIYGIEASGRPDQWAVRPVPDINRDLSVCFGVPVEFDRKIDELRRIAQALSRGDLMHAQIATLHLQIPDPPALPWSEQAPGEIVQVARQLQASELLNAD